MPIPIPIPGVAVTAADVSNLSTNINGARAFHATINGVVHPKTAILFGDIINTDAEFDWTIGQQPASPSGSGGSGGASGASPNAGVQGAGGGPSPSQPITASPNMALKRPAGDGTVPSLSARFTLAGPKFFRRSFPVLHSDCFSDPGFRAEVFNQVLRFAGLTLPTP